MRTKKSKIEKYSIFIMSQELSESSGLDNDATIEEVREFARKQNGKVAHRVFDSERDCLVYFMALCDSGRLFDDYIHYYLFTEPTVETIDEPELVWYHIMDNFMVSSMEKNYDYAIAIMHKLQGLDINGLVSKEIETKVEQLFKEEHLYDIIWSMNFSLGLNFAKALNNYYLDKYIGYIDPKEIENKDFGFDFCKYIEFMKEKRDYPELRDK